MSAELDTPTHLKDDVDYGVFAYIMAFRNTDTDWILKFLLFEDEHNGAVIT